MSRRRDPRGDIAVTRATDAGPAVMFFGGEEDWGRTAAVRALRAAKLLGHVFVNHDGAPRGPCYPQAVHVQVIPGVWSAA